MTPNPSLDSVGPLIADAESREHGDYKETPQWPLTRLAAVSLSALLLLALTGPTLLTGIDRPRLLVLLAPSLLAVAVARVAFESLRRSRTRRLREHIVPALVGSTTSTLLLGVSALIVGVPWSLSCATVTGVATTAVLTVAGASRDLEVRVRTSMRRVFFVGSQAARRDLENELACRSDARLVGSYPANGPAEAGRLVEHVLAANATVLVLDRDAMTVGALVEGASTLNLKGVRVRDLVSYYESEFKKIPLAELTPTWFLFDIAPIHRRFSRDLLWRVSETLVAGVVLVLVSPMLLLIMAIIRGTSDETALYRQQRVGKAGEPFTLLKLRTMTGAGASADWAGSQSHRVTPFGRFLRRFRLDELPQLLNIVSGDLALIGPRPEQVPIVERLEREIPFYSARHSVRPGLTGWAQVTLGYSGSYAGTLAKLQRDLYYIKHCSWRLDCVILWLTIKAVVTGPRS